MSHNSYNCSSGHKSQPPGYCFQSRDYEHFQLIFVRQGNLYFSHQNSIKALGPGNVLLLRPGGDFRLSCGNTGYSGVFFAAYDNDPLAVAGEPVTVRATPPMVNLAQMMEQEIRHARPDSQHMLNAAGRALSIAAVRLAERSIRQRGKADYGKYWAESARQALLASLHTGKGAREILAALPLSYRQVSRYFSATYSASPKQYLIHARIHEAQRMLTTTDLPITVIAYELHFSSSQHFATQFAQITGLPPSVFRARHSRQ